MLIVYLIHMTEWRIKLRGKILNGVRSVGHVSFKQIWVSQVERVEGAVHGQTLSACSVGSRIETARVF